MEAQPFLEHPAPLNPTPHCAPRPPAARPEAAGLRARIGSLFRSARLAQDLTQGQVAALTRGLPAPVSRSAVSAVERGRILPGLEVLASLAMVLHVDPAEILERLGPACAGPVGGADGTLDELEREAATLLDRGNPRRALAIYGAILNRVAHRDAGKNQMVRRLRARVELGRARALRWCGAPRAASFSAQRAIELSEDAPDLQAEAYMLLASLLSDQRLRILAVDAADRAIALSPSGGDGLQGRAWATKGRVLCGAGRFEPALHAFLRGAEFARKAEDHRTMVTLEGQVGLCLLRMGHPRHAWARFARAVRMARRYRDSASEAFWLVELARRLFEDGRLEEADGHARAALRTAFAADDRTAVFCAEWVRHLVARRTNPGTLHNHRLAYLRRLYGSVRGHLPSDTVREFEEQVLGASRNGSHPPRTVPDPAFRSVAGPRRRVPPDDPSLRSPGSSAVGPP